ncbi:MFS transporter [Planotetraspora thailandica]|uniref:MFS transporter n=1 Tax=Planotetraspora thailandica TaxID=487172 RepID=A0A8J3V1G5_9ACTN|nr:MFS transporter [Planotetraspora thailandica]GII54956.1 MFS transporter [Planotetraspora thailandica]
MTSTDAGNGYTLTRGVTLLFAVACGTAVAGVYFAQPLLVTLGSDFSITPALLGFVVTLTQIGYGLGLFFLVPLGDLVDPRRLVVTQLLLLAAALVVVGLATTGAVLLAGMVAVGLLAVVTQTLVAFAASLAPAARRGRVVGLVTSGVVTGILLARTVSGILADLAGWRWVYLSSAAACCVLALALRRALPYGTAKPYGTADARVQGYRRLLRSTIVLFTREPVLRLRAAFALLIFAAFGTLWSCVALPLSAPPLSLSHTQIGAFGLAGAAGALAAALAGRLNDRGRSRWTTGAGLALLAVSWLPLASTRQSLWALAVGVVVLDLAVQTVHVTNQSLIYALHPGAGSRIIGGYMVFYSIGSACGAAGSTAMYAAAGWGGVCALGAAISCGALLLWACSGDARPRRSPRAADRRGAGTDQPCDKP